MLAEPLSASQTIEWYVDGKLDETVNTDEAASGKYTLTFPNGSYIVTAIVRDTDTLMAVGSIAEFKVVVNKIMFEPVENGGEVIRFSFSQDDWDSGIKMYRIHVDGIADKVSQFFSEETRNTESEIYYGVDGGIKIRVNGDEYFTHLAGTAKINYFRTNNSLTVITGFYENYENSSIASFAINIANSDIEDSPTALKDDVLITYLPNEKTEPLESQIDVELEFIPDEFQVSFLSVSNVMNMPADLQLGLSNWLRHNATYDSEGNVTNIEARFKKNGGDWIDLDTFMADAVPTWIASNSTGDAGIYIFGDLNANGEELVERDFSYTPGTEADIPIIVEFKRTGAAPEPVTYSGVFDKPIEDVSLTGYMAHLDGLHDALLAVIEKTGVARIEVYLDGERMNIPLAADDGVGAINMSVANDAYIQNPSENLTEGQVMGSLMIFGQLGPSSPEDIVKDDVFPYVADGSAEDFSVWQDKEIEIRIY